MSHGADSTKSIIYALVANFLIAIAKFAAAYVTKSGSMLAEAIHSLVDSSNQVLLLMGLKRSKAPEQELSKARFRKPVRICFLPLRETQWVLLPNLCPCLSQRTHLLKSALPPSRVSKSPKPPLAPGIKTHLSTPETRHLLFLSIKKHQRRLTEWKSGSDLESSS